MRSKTEKPSSTSAILAGLVALVLFPLGAYVAGYFVRGEWIPINKTPKFVGARCYPTRWEKSLFTPAANLETWLRGSSVEAITDARVEGDDKDFLPNSD
jgi:hypothetical protein